MHRCVLLENGELVKAQHLSASPAGVSPAAGAAVHVAAADNGPQHVAVDLLKVLCTCRWLYPFAAMAVAAVPVAARAFAVPVALLCL